jgi:hypothetical protein
LTLLAFVRKVSPTVEKIDMIGFGSAGRYVAGPRAIAGGKIDRTAIDTARFRFANITAFDDPEFLPGSVKYGDLPAILALSAPHRLWLAGEGGKNLKLVAATYRAAGYEDRLSVFPGDEKEKETAILKWMTRMKEAKR